MPLGTGDVVLVDEFGEPIAPEVVTGPPTPLTTYIGRPWATWTDPTGTEWSLSDIADSVGWFTRRGPGGWGANPIEIIGDPLARGGEEVRFIRSLPRRITWPLHIYGDTHDQFVTRYRNLMRAFTQTTHRRTPGILRVARPDGTAREIDAWYESGFEGEAGENHLSANPVVTLYCPDGFWRDITPVTVTRSYSDPAPFLEPYPTVSSSSVLGATTVDNVGDVVAWPEWTITGPMTSITATNNELDAAFTLTYTLSGGEQATITTNRPMVRGPAGQNIVGSLNWPGAYLWGLMPGSNSLDFSVAGAASGTSITMTYYPRYETA